MNSSSTRFALLAAAIPALGGCSTIQSALDPAGVNARQVTDLWWLMLWVLGGAFVIVMAALAAALFAPRPWRERLRGTTMIAAGGVALPVAVVPVFLIASFTIDWPLVPERPDRLTIHVVGHQFWWEVRYTGPGIARPIVSANEIRMPVGQPVQFRLTTEDVIHSFWLPNLAGKIDMIPGQVNHMEITAERTGVFRGQCYEFCGAQHAHMAFMAVVMEPGDFASWLAREAQPAPAPSGPEEERALQAFLRGGCASCHAIRGTPADGEGGPDLTHVGGRLTLAAGMLPNGEGSMGGWIAGAQTIKPGNRMPNFNGFDGETLRALSSYLYGLK